MKSRQKTATKAAKRPVKVPNDEPVKKVRGTSKPRPKASPKDPEDVNDHAAEGSDDFTITDILSAFERDADAGRSPERMVELDHVGSDPTGDPPDLSVAELFGAADWLTDSVGTVGEWADARPNDPVDFQERNRRTLDSDQEPLIAALRHGAHQGRRLDTKLRRLNPRIIQDLLEDFFAEDETRLCMAYAARLVVSDALLEKDAWSFEWIFGVDGISREDLPPRSKLLELFDARDITLQTRVQYQMWLDGVVYSMRFPTQSMPRRHLMKINGILAEHELIGWVAEAVELAEVIWRNPGITEEALWTELADRGIRCQPEDITAYTLILELLSDSHLLSLNAKNAGWYMTGVNPRRLAAETRLIRPGSTGSSVHRSWSQWW